MIPANELRVGNIVSLGWQKEILPLRIKSIGETGVNGEEAYEHPDEDTVPSWDEEKYDTLSPVPLTPEVLEKAGFVKRVYETEEQQELYGDEIIYYLPDGEEETFILTPKDDGWLLCDHSIAKCQLFKYLHQIQNLVHALTGTELEIKDL